MTTEVWLVDLDNLDVAAVTAVFSACAYQRAEIGDDLARLLATPQSDPKRAAAHWALRVVLTRTVGVAKALAPFSRAPLGKPYLPGTGGTFSLAHSGSHALIATASSGEIGCDIEAPRTPRLPEARRALILAAAVDIAGGSPLLDGSAQQKFLQAWVRLEAAAKATGEGMGRLLTRYGIVGTAEDRSRIAAGAVLAKAPQLQVLDLDLADGYVAAIAELGAADRSQPKLQRLPTDPGALIRWMQTSLVTPR